MSGKKSVREKDAENILAELSVQEAFGVGKEERDASGGSSREGGEAFPLEGEKKGGGGKKEKASEEVVQGNTKTARERHTADLLRKPMQRERKRPLRFNARGAAKKVEAYRAAALTDPERKDFDLKDVTGDVTIPEIREAYNALIARARQANPELTLRGARELMRNIPDPLTAAREQAGFLSNIPAPEQRGMSFG